jgi:hypothetical protein
MGRRLVLAVAVLVLGTFLLSPAAVAQQGLPPGSLVIKVLTERIVPRLPVGRPRLYWRIENLPSLAEAQAAAGTWGLAVEVSGRAWLFTLSPKGGSTAGGTKVAEVGPLPPVVAPAYLLRINEPSGVPGSITIVHTHPGTEALYALAGELCLRSPRGVIRLTAGQGAAGPDAYVPTQVSSCGSTDLRGFVMFVVDATQPFSSPATFP